MIPEMVVEIAKVLITSYFTYAKEKGLSKEQINNLYLQIKYEFEENNPDKLEEV